MMEVEKGGRAKAAGVEVLGKRGGAAEEAGGACGVWKEEAAAVAAAAAAAAAALRHKRRPGREGVVLEGEVRTATAGARVRGEQSAERWGA